MKTKYLSVKHKSLVEGYPSFGPRPNITGCKKKYNLGYTVMCGSYLYNLGKGEDGEMFWTSWED